MQKYPHDEVPYEIQTRDIQPQNYTIKSIISSISPALPLLLVSIKQNQIRKEQIHDWARRKNQPRRYLYVGEKDAYQNERQ